jgi:hypothetical protein
MLDENGKIKYKQIKYNLKDLFDNTPIFDTPPLNFIDESK